MSYGFGSCVGMSVMRKRKKYDKAIAIKDAQNAEKADSWHTHGVHWEDTNDMHPLRVIRVSVSIERARKRSSKLFYRMLK